MMGHPIHQPIRKLINGQTNEQSSMRRKSGQARLIEGAFEPSFQHF